MPHPAHETVVPERAATRGPIGGRSRASAVLACLLLPLAVYALPYLLGRASAAPGVATFTVDEPLYLTEAMALARSSPADWNPWTRTRGSATDTYRAFPGALLPAALWERSGADRTLGLAAAAGLAAALATLLGALVLRRLLPDDRRAWTWALAPLIVLLPWHAPGEVLRLGLRTEDLVATLPLARPFTTQWGPVVFLLGLWATLRSSARATAGRSLLLVVALLAQVYTFPFAVPITLGLHAVLSVAAYRRGDRSVRRVLTSLVPVVLLMPAVLWAATRTLPADAEAALDVVSSPRFGGSGVATLVLAAVAWFARRSFRPESALFLPALGLLLSVMRLADFLVPARLQFTHHVSYLADSALAVTVIALLWALRPDLQARARGVLPVGILALALGYAGWCTARAVAAREPALERHGRWASTLSRLPAEPGLTLLTEGESLDGPGAWSGLLAPLPSLYCVTAEYSTTPSLDDRQWRRAWYHYFRGLSSEEVAREGALVARRFPRIFGAHNNAPSADVLPALARRLSLIERGDPEAWNVLRGFGRIACLEEEEGATFRPERLGRFLRNVERRAHGHARLTLYEVRGS